MIRSITLVAYDATRPSGLGPWFYGEPRLVITCDAEGCTATTTPEGTDHNGSSRECLYMHKRDRGWRLGTQDHCPKHAPLVDEDDPIRAVASMFRERMYDDDAPCFDFGRVEPERVRAFLRALGRIDE